VAKSSQKNHKFVETSRTDQKTKAKKKRVNTTRVDSALQARVLERTAQRDEANRKLSQTRNTFENLFQDNPIPLALTRLEDGTFLNVNAAFLKFFDFRRDEVIGRTTQSLRLGMEASSFERLRAVDLLRKEGGVLNYERELLLPSGKQINVLASLQYFCIDDTEAILKAFTDNTNQKRAQEVLHKLMDAAPDATVVFREDGTITFVNKQMENVFGYAGQDLIGKPLTELIPERFHDLYMLRSQIYFNDAGEDQIGSSLKLYGRRWDGTEFPVEINLSPVKLQEGTLVIAAIRDITKRIESERKIRRLASLLSEAEQKERERISQVLHDDLQQRLFAAKLQLSLLEQAYTEGNQDTVRLTLGELDSYLAESIAITRNLSVEFSPGTLQEENLANALAALSTQMQNQYGLNVTLQTNEIETNLDRRMSGLIYQMARELLFNVVKHSGTLQAELTLERVNDELRITVSDGGQGFDPNVVMSSVGVAHGLLNIRQRLELLGCRMEISSKPGAGSRISIYCLDSN
jgi:PAS domain S-box-containing protein